MAGRTEAMNEITISTNDILIDKSHDGLLGKGGYGSVYRANYKGQKVAVKMCCNDGQITKNERYNLKKEARRLMMFCDHPNIVKLLGIIMEPNNYSIVLEYMDFGTSYSFIDKYIVGIPLRIQFTQQIISAMAWLHSQKPPVKHLDMKADNVLIDNYFNAKICDFGLSEWRTVTSLVTKTQTLGDNDGARAGTLTHIPPEVFLDIHKKGTVEEDVYAFAITLWEIFSGKKPFANCRNNIKLISQAVLTNQRPNMNELNSECPQQIRDIIQLSWDKQPRNRPTFGELERNIGPIYKSVEAGIPEDIHYIRAQICECFENGNEPEYYAEDYECTHHLDNMGNRTPQTNGDMTNGNIRSDISPDGDKNITVSATTPPNSNDDSTQNHSENLENGLSQLSLNRKNPEPSSQNEFATPIRHSPLAMGISRPRQAGLASIRPQVCEINKAQVGVASVGPNRQAQVLNNAQAEQQLENLTLAHVPISETRPNQIEDGTTTQKKPEDFLSGFVSVRDKQYTPGFELEHPHGPFAQPESARLLNGTGRQAVEGSDESQSINGTANGAVHQKSSKEKAVDDFLSDLSISNPELLATLLKSPDALESVLSIVQSGGGIETPVSRPSELTIHESRRLELSDSQPSTQPQPTKSCAGEANQPLQTLNGQISVDQFSQYSSNAKPSQQQTHQETQQTPLAVQQMPMMAHPTSRATQQTSNASQQPPVSMQQKISTSKEETVRMFPAPPPGGHQFGTSASQPKPVTNNRLPSSDPPVHSNAPEFVTPKRHIQVPVQSVFGRPVYARPGQPIMLRNPPNGQFLGTNFKQNEAWQAASGRTSHSTVNNSIFGQQITNKSGQPIIASAQPFPSHSTSSSRQRTMQGIVQENRVASNPPDVGRERAAVQQEASNQPVHEMQNSTRSHQQNAVPNMSSSRQRSPVETAEHLRSAQGPRQHNQMPSGDKSPSGKQPITLLHKHAGGEVTTITMDPNSELPPNLQIGNNNTMVVNPTGGKKKTEKKQKQPKCRKSQLPTSTNELSMDHIDMVSVEIGKDWKRLCRQLDMTEADIEQLQFDYHVSGLYEITYQAIQRWIQRNGRDASVKKMAEALWEIDRDELALRLQ